MIVEMNIISQEQLSQSVWDAALTRNPHANLLQSWAWGEFQSQIGNPVWRFAVTQNEDIVLQVQVIKQTLGFSQSILYAPRADLINKQLPAQELNQALKLLLKEVVELAMREKCILFRIDPPTLATDVSSAGLYRSLKFVTNAKKNIQPKYVQLLDLKSDLAGTLASAKSKTRYNANLGQRNLDDKKIELHTTAQPETITAFLSLLRKTGANQGFTPHSSRYLKTQIETLTRSDVAELLTVSTTDNPPSWLAGIFVAYFNQTATYVHGASSKTSSNLMGSYLLHATAINHSIAKGMNHYELGGVNPNPNHPWSGITRFKQGFGGKMIEYIGTMELPIQPFKYKIYRLMNLFR